MLNDFLIRAALAGVGVAIAAAPLGCFVVWRRMAYFGDATAHAAVLGVALALAWNLPIFSMVLIMAVTMGLTVTALSGRTLALDTLLGVLAHSALAIGLVAVSVLEGIRVDLMAFLFGDILAVSRPDLAVIWGGAAVIVGLMSWRWSALLSATVNPELALASGINPQRESLWLTLALAVVVAVALKVVGVLLIAAMLIIPAAAARPLAATPERMAVLAAVLGSGSALGGLWVSFIYDTPTGPTIVCTATALFAAVMVASAIKRAF